MVKVNLRKATDLAREGGVSGKGKKNKRGSSNLMQSIVVFKYSGPRASPSKTIRGLIMSNLDHLSNKVNEKEST